MVLALRRTLTPCSQSLTSRQASRFFVSTSVRTFHRPSSRPSPSALTALKSTGSESSLGKASDVFRQSFRRSYMQETYRVPRPDAGSIRQRLLYGAGLVGGTIVLTNLIFNRETREDGGMPHYERSYLNETFMHTGLGIGIIGVAARAMHQNGWSYRLMAANPWAVLGVSLVASIGTMMATFATPPDR